MILEKEGESQFDGLRNKVEESLEGFSIKGVEKAVSDFEEVLITNELKKNESGLLEKAKDHIEFLKKRDGFLSF